MEYIYKRSPIFAFCVQKIGLDDWFDSPCFKSTCFIPCSAYSEQHLEYIMSQIDYQMARNVVMLSLVRGRVTRDFLSTQEYIPTYDKYQDLRVEQVDGDIILNKDIFIVKSDLEFNNGMVHVVNGFLQSTTEV